MKGYIKRTDGIITQYECEVCHKIFMYYFLTPDEFKRITQEHRKLHKLKYTNSNNLKSWSI